MVRIYTLFLWKLFKKILPKTILDLGCGTCRLWEEFPKNILFTGIDISAEMLEIAQKKEISGEWICSDLLNLDLKEKNSILYFPHTTLSIT
ncbi:methyltransferase domain protein [Leptospira interrogans str. 2006001854]|uniref:Methyltransferase domain protein n=1 Tax=Leptospira interrogans str. 2006001854 TaxID=1001590 RepID=M6GQI9_LEPIR|nr:methyltransferase domain protein [Leptospira interrogans str. 2006001854]